jgi:hypothetical protein
VQALRTGPTITLQPKLVQMQRLPAEERRTTNQQRQGERTMILTVSIDLNKLPDDVSKRCLALMDVFHQLAHEAVTVGGGLTSVIPVLSHHRGPVAQRVGEWQVHFDTGIDS